MKKVLALVPAAALASVATPALAAAATGPDYSTLTANIDFGSTMTALLAVGALIVTVAVVVMGIRKIKSMIR